MKRRRRLALVALAALVVAAATWGLAPKAHERQPLGLFTSLPMLWAEAPDVAAMLATPEPPHWARTQLEKRYKLVPLNTITGDPALHDLLIAQPRPFSPDENVSLDGWVRRGGRVLMFADPALTWESSFPIGDRRRPQDVVLLSPILARWGLELRFDDQQPAGMREIPGSAIPVNLAGSLELKSGGVDSRCTIERAGLVAACAVGRGRVLVVADAAMLEPADDLASREQALRSLTARAFAD